MAAIAGPKGGGKGAPPPTKKLADIAAAQKKSFTSSGRVSSLVAQTSSAVPRTRTHLSMALRSEVPGEQDGLIKSAIVGKVRPGEGAAPLWPLHLPTPLLSHPHDLSSSESSDALYIPVMCMPLSTVSEDRRICRPSTLFDGPGARIQPYRAGRHAGQHRAVGN
jgi:hypothetical protein